MEIVFLIISLASAALGTWLLLRFLFWRGQGAVTGATIIGFQDKKDKGMALPIVSFEYERMEDDEIKTTEVKAEVRCIEQFLFLLNRPKIDDFTTVIYDKDNPKKVKIYGYIYILASALLFAPLGISMGLKLRSAVLLGQVSYLLVFIAIIFGGWIVLKLLQRFY